MTALSIVLAVASAAFFAVSAVLQQRGTQAIPSDVSTGGLGFVLALFRNRIWLAGLAVNLIGFALQAGALAVGSLLLVQPFTVTTLLFALPLAASTEHRRLRKREWSWAGVLVAALAVFVIVGEPERGIAAPAFTDWTVPLLILAVVCASSVLYGRRLPRGGGRSLVLAVGAGVILGYSAPFTKTAMDALGQSLITGLTTWELWAMIAASSIGTLWQQASFRSGSVQTSLPTVTVVKPMVATALGLTIYHEHMRIDHVGEVLVVVSLGVMIVAAYALSRLSTIPEPPLRVESVDTSRHGDDDPLARV